MATKLSSGLRPSRKRELSSRELDEWHDIADDVIESDFVPYACLYDPNTLLTKDGELIQIIKISGLALGGDSPRDLRAAVRAAIAEAIPDDSYAIWLHTLRRKQQAHTHSHFPDAFSGKLDEAWRATQPANLTFANELYVSIVRAGEPVSLRNLALLKRSFFPKRDVAAREAAIRRAHEALSNVAHAMLGQLRPFGARLLGCTERDGVIYGEHLEFLEKLINLEERPMPLPERDLSHVLTSGDITFGFNAMEVRTAEGVRRFAAILTLKEYKESTLAGIDQFLEIPCELIISQCFDFSGAQEAEDAYAKQARYLRYSGDKELAQWMEIDRLTDHTARTGKPKRFGRQQTTLFLITPSVNQLESNLKMVQRALNRLGMVVIREDLRFEDCYWAQLPANSAFIARHHPVDTDHLAGFVNLQTAPMGNAQGSPWGQPVCIFHTIQDRPYHFNFHRQHAAHSIVLGRTGSGRTSLTHFLLAQTRKLPVRIWYLDTHGRAGDFLQAMGGQYVAPGSASCKLNPFLLPETAQNREFLALWLSTLIDPTGAQLNRSTLSFFQSVIDQMMRLPLAQRRMAAMQQMLRDADPLLGQALQPFVAGGAFGELFDMPEDQFRVDGLIGFDLRRWMADPKTRIPLTGYLLQRLTGSLDRAPTLIVLDEGFELLNNPLFSIRAGAWLDFLAQHNTGVLISASGIEQAAALPFTAEVSAKAASIFALPDLNPSDAYTQGFGLNPAEISTLGAMQPSARQALLKRGAEAYVIQASLNALPTTTLQILRGMTLQRQAA